MLSMAKRVLKEWTSLPAACWSKLIRGVKSFRQRASANAIRDGMQLIVKLAIGLAAIYAVVAVCAFVLQRRLMYFPDPTRLDPHSFNLPRTEERVIDASDGARLISWFAPSAPGRPTILYFHGNGGNLGVRSERLRRFLG